MPCDTIPSTCLCFLLLYLFSAGVGRRGGVGKVGLVYHTPSPVKAAGLTSVSLDIPCNSIETLLNSGGSTTPSSGDKTMPTQLQKLLGDLVHTHFHLKLHVSVVW